MTNRSIIRSLEVSDFRGLEGNRTIDFEGADIVLLLGLNGFGKTSLFDAIEWCFTGKLGRYEQYNEVGRKQDFGKEKEVLRNKYAANPNTFVKVQLDNGKIFGRRVLTTGNESDYNEGSIITGCEFGIDSISKEIVNQALSNSYFSATHILSQETINHFVTSKKPEERYQALSVNFGTAIFAPFENNVQVILGMIVDQEKGIAYDISSKMDTIKVLNQQIRLKEKEIVAVLNEADSQISKLKILGVEIPTINLEFSNSIVNMEVGIDDQVANVRSKTSLTYFNKKERMAGLYWLKNNGQSWVTGNDALLKIESEISTDRKKLADIDDLKKFIRNQNNDIALIKNNVETKKVKKATLKMVLDGFSSFKETHNKISLLEKEILDRRNSISTAKENKDDTEKKLKSVKQNISNNLESLKTEEAFLSDVNRAKDFIINYAVERENHISEIDELNNNVQKIKNDIGQYISLLNLLSLSEKDLLIGDIFHGKSERNLIPNQYSEDFERIINTIKNWENDIKNVTTKENEVREKAEETKSRFSETRKLLSMALLQIDVSQEAQGCPVCDTMHSTVDIKNHIENKLGTEESECLKLVEQELKEIQESKLHLKANVENAKHELEDISKKLKSYFSDIIKDKGSKASNLSNSVSNLRIKLKEMDVRYKEIVVRFDKKFGRTAQNFSDINDTISSSINEKKKSIENDRAEEQKLKEKMSDLEMLLSKGRKINEETLSDISSLKDTVYLNILEHIGNFGISPSQSGAESILQEMQNNNERELAALSNSIASKDSDLKEAQKKVNELLGGDSEDEFRTTVVQKGEDISKLKKELSTHLERLSKLGISPEDYTNKNIAQLVEKNEAEIKLLEQQFEVIESLMGCLTKIKEYNLDKASRDNILKSKRQIEDLKERKTTLSEVKKELNKLKRDYPKVLKGLIKDNLDVDLFNKIYELLNPHRRFKMIDFNVDINRNKIGINFNAKHSKVKGRPEFLFSSAQLNTFGICMFLSMALRQNWLDLNTILIDDPIQNLDDINILSLIDFLRGLLDSEHDKKQIILSTHDERFYDLMVRKFQNYNLKTFKYESYGKILPDVLPKALS